MVVGGGFAGAGVARRLERRLPGADIRLVCPEDYSLYLPLLPQVAAGVIPPRAAVISLARRLRRTTIVPGRVVGADLDARRVVVESITGEQEVLGYLAQLLTTDEIAATMFVSVNTVRSHVRSILRKLGVTRRNQAVRRAWELQLLPPRDAA